MFLHLYMSLKEMPITYVMYQCFGAVVSTSDSYSGGPCQAKVPLSKAPVASLNKKLHPH